MPKPQNRKVRSSCWYFYDKTTDGGVCKICNKSVRSTGNTTNLLNHLKRRHPVEFRDNDNDYVDERYNDHESMSPATAQQHESEDASRTLVAHQQATMEAYQAEQGGTVIWLESTDNHNNAYQPQITIVGHVQNGEGEQHTEEEGMANSGEANSEQQEGSTEENNGADAGSKKQTNESSKPTKVAGKMTRTRLASRTVPSTPYTPPRPQAIGSAGSPASSGPLRFEDPFEAFGRYVASLLRNLRSRRGAFRLQKDIVWQILQEQMRDC